MTIDRDSFVLENLGLAHSCARRYSGRGIEYDDLFQTACVGLLKAVDNFDAGRNVCFSTYAVPVILGEIKQLFRNSGSIKASRKLKEIGIKSRRLSDEFAKENGRSPKMSELAQLLGTTAQEITEALCVIQQPDSFDRDDISANISVGTHFDELTIERVALRQIIEMLGETDRAIIIMRYIEEKTQSNTAQVLGMTQVQVSRRERRLLNFIRAELAG